MKKLSTPNLSAVLWLLLLLGAGQALAQQVPKMAPYGRGYLEYLPPGYDTSTELYPCIIFLHGSGERGTGTASQLAKVANNGPPKHVKNGHKMCFTVAGKTECFIVLSPQTNDWSWKFDVVPFVQYALETYRIDPDRIYLTGLSMGGEGTWLGASYADNEPNYFAALGVMCGRAGGPDGCNVQNKKVAVWAFHGDNDTAIPIAAGLRPVNGMKGCGGNPIWTVYAGVSHGGCWDRGYRTDHTYHNPNLYEWFLSIKRNNPGPRPPTVNAGADVTITLPLNTTTLTATATDADGTIATRNWAQVSGPNTAGIATPSSLATVINGLAAGTYVFSFTATDDTGLSTTDQVTVRVNPAPTPVPPTANAGPDRTITAPANSLSPINGSGADTDGTIASYAWTQTAGPNTATLTGAATATLGASNLVVGAYSFTLTVTDNSGLQGSDQMVLTVLPAPPNAAPEANAGPDRTITLPVNLTNLTGSGTDSDGTIASYAWTQNSGPNTATIGSPAQGATQVSGLVQGVYVFTLQVTDDNGSTDNDQVIVTVLPVPPNNLPLASAGSDISITLPVNTTVLNGSGTDADGTIATYAWTQTSGPNTATIATPGAATTNLSGLIEGNYLFQLTVTDDDGGQGSDQVLVQVLPVPPNNPPVANAGANVNVSLPLSTASLNGSGNDTDGTIASYQWAWQSGPNTPTIATPTLEDTDISGLIEGVYTFQLTVTDDDGATGSDQVIVTVFPVANIPPTANAGADFSITLPTNSTPLSGSGTDPDGTISAYLWEQVNGPNTAVITNGATANPTISSLTDGIYIFTLTVTDDDGVKGTDQVQVTVLPQPPNQPPVASAGPDITLTLPANTATLNGSGTDADGIIVSYHWNLLAGPATITLSDVDLPVLNVSDLEAGTYSFELVIADDRGATVTDEVKIFVNALNLPPVASAGPDRNITLPVSNTTLNGTANDPDGTITARLWEQLSGPNTAVIATPGNLNTNITGLIAGIYIFTFEVTDDDGVTDSDEVRVVVNPAPPNTPPVANAGPNLEITLPDNSVTITGSGTDSDGTIVSYLWSQVGGPGTASHSSLSQASITWSNLVAGTYIFRLRVTDDDGANGQRDVSVKVNPQPANIPPVANAGANDQITLPVNTISLTGSGSDTDGTISTYLWQQVNGPSPADFTTPGSANTNVTDLVEGIYVFRLTVTDDDGVSAFDEVAITVRPIPANLPPIANGGGNKVITLPLTNTTLNGSGTDADGSVVGYNWVQVSGPTTATTTDPTIKDIDISDLAEGIYLFRLTVTDDKGSTGFDEINIRVQPVPANQPPTANAGGNKIITLPTVTATFNGSGTDPDGTIASHAWTQVAGPSAAALSGQATADLTANNMLEGTYIFRLTVTDNLGAIGFDEVNVRVNPTPPNAPPQPQAGSNIAITLPVNSVTLDGAASTDVDGTIATYAWSRLSGPSNPTVGAGDVVTVAGLVQGIYIFRLTVTDDDGASAFDDVQVTVNPEPPNNPPSADAGIDQIIAAPPFGLNVTGTANDTDGPAPTVEWTQVSGPNTATLTNPTSLTVTIGGLQEGTYIFRLTAEDEDGDTGSDEMTLTVNGNQSPVAFAGGTINIVLPDDDVVLTGSGSDADGAIADYQWVRVSGPNTPTVTPGAEPNEVILDGLVEGQYVYTLTVTDDKGATDEDQITIDVTTIANNQPPVARPGENIIVLLPNNSVTLNGLASSDADGTVTDFAWEQVGGTPATLSDTTFAELLVADLTQGVYVFALTVTDDDGATHTAEVTVNVTNEEETLTSIPKVFTPNNDERGQTWQWPAAILEQYDGCELSIYSRFGKKVFEMVSYDNSWDGTSRGVKLEDEAYYYVIKCSDGQQTTGGVRIVR
ncbi:MAG TPA: gliding motility-associated C-terminal domain-containing protein [Ohtaekwangia sp.]|nr:gliding motility-associated C-terminal domain-containing protein [Ohtaekwangia sp.]